MKFLLDFGPLLVFFVANARAGIRVATAAFVVAILAALALTWRRERRLPMVPLVTAAFVVVFGGLTIWLDDELFIQLKPTVAYLFLGGALAWGELRGRSLLRHLLGDALELRPEGWRLLARAWIGFFLVMAGVNEVARRVLTLDQWVTFKVFGLMALSLVFAVGSMLLVQRHVLRAEAEAGDEGADAP